MEQIDLRWPLPENLSKHTMELLQKETINAYEADGEVHKSIAASYDIQRRGLHYPGDTNSFSPYGNLGSDSLSNCFLRDQTSQMTASLGLFGLDNNIQFYNAPGGTIDSSMSNPGSSLSTVSKTKMALCVQAYKGFGVAKNVIDLMANFAAEGIKINHPRPQIRKFYQRWMEIVDLPGRVKDILRYYYKFGNVFIYTTWGVIDAETYNSMKMSKAFKASAVTDTQDPVDSQREKQVEEEKNKALKDRQIPWRYTLLNPFQMDLLGDKFFGTSKWVFVLDPRTQEKVIKLPSLQQEDFLDETEVNLPPEFKNIANKKDPRVVELKQENLWTMHYMKDDHEDWADPMLWPVMADIFYKNKLRQSDISICNSIIKAITVFKLGDYKNGFIPDSDYMRKFGELLRTPSEAMTMVWNDAIEVINSYPPTERMLSVDKYESVDRDILRGLGIPDILLGGAGANYSSGFLGVRTLLERLEEGRGEVEKWVNKQLRQIANVMGHRDVPKIKFGRMSLRDESAEKQLILGLLDRNIISIEAVLEVFGEDFELELARLRNEEDIRTDEGLLQKHGPFVDPLSDMTSSDNLAHENNQIDTQHKQDMEKMDVQMQQQMKFKQMDNQLKKTDMQARRLQLKQGQKAKNINGRPGNSKNIPQQKKRATKPKGMAYIVEYEQTKKLAAELYSSIHGIITECVLQDTGKKYLKSLSNEQRFGIDELSFAVASYLIPEEEVTLDRVKEIMGGESLFVFEPIGAAESMLLSSFIELNSRTPTMEEKRDIRARAITSFWMDDNEEN